MTVGEKIQQLRKQNQLSQEELGQQLFVSRQTVSLWENGQTLPTIDNLMRLKEIFGVSLDTLLSKENLPKEETQNFIEPPIESYVFNYSKKDLKYIKPSLIANSILLNAMIVLYIFLSRTLSNIIDKVEADTMLSLAFTFIHFILVVILGIIVITISIRFKEYMVKTEAFESFYSSSFIYDIYRHFIVVRTLNSNDIVKTEKIYYCEFKCCYDTPDSFVLVSGKKNPYILKKSQLCADSYIKAFCNSIKTPKTDLSNPKEYFIKKLSNVFLLLTFLSPIIAFIIIMLHTVSSSDNFIFTAWWYRSVKWLFITVVPIPAILVIIGIIQQKKTKRRIINITIGLIFTVCLTAEALLPFAFGMTSARVEEIENQLNIQLPETSFCAVYEKANSFNLFFDYEDTTKFRELVQNDTRWINGSGQHFSDIIAISERGRQSLEIGYSLLYNTKTEQYNQYPTESGQYHYIYMAFSPKNNYVIITEYFVVF